MHHISLTVKTRIGYLIIIIGTFIALQNFVACRPKNDHYVIKGVLHNVPANVKKVYLEQILINSNAVIDTATLEKDGSFEMDGFLNELSLCRLRFTQTGFVYLVAKNGDNITVDINFNAIEKYSVSGSPASSSLKAYQDTIVQYNSAYNALLAKMKTTTTDDSTGKALYGMEDAQAKAMKEHLFTYTVKYADTAKNPVNGIFALAENFPPKETYYDYLKTYSANLSKNYAYLAIAQQFSDLINHNLINNQFSKLVKVGGMAPEISIPDRDGKILTLSSLRGKYVLIDFWASWCRPCRSENPNVYRAYKKFKDKNFTIYSVSLDTRKAEWEAAIEADSLVWPNHVCDFKDWHTPAQDAYGFEAIPYNVLINPDGKILAFDLHGDSLMHVLKNTLETPAKAAKKTSAHKAAKKKPA